MTKPTSYQVEHLAGRGLDRLTEAVERECLLELSDTAWCIYFRDTRRALSCGLSDCAMSVETLSRHRCRLCVTDVVGGGFDLELVLRAPADRVRGTLEHRLAALERSRLVAEAVDSGDWWLDARVFDALDWAGVRSIAGIRYRHGWWGTGRMNPSMSAKVLDFGPRGIRLRGLRTCFVIPWDAIEGIRVVDGDAWVPESSPGQAQSGPGATIVVTSGSGQDAVFFTPLFRAVEVRDLLEPLTRHLRGPSSAISGAAST